MNCAIGTKTLPIARIARRPRRHRGGFGNSCTYANDGECDEPFCCACSTDQNIARIGIRPQILIRVCAVPHQAGPVDSAVPCNDGECDEPYYCAIGTDGNDCQ